MQFMQSIAFDSEVLNKLYPIHFILDDSGTLIAMSTELTRQFPKATVLTDFLAPNSAEELRQALKKANEEIGASFVIDLFSIQHYALLVVRKLNTGNRKTYRLKRLSTASMHSKKQSMRSA